MDVDVQARPNNDAVDGDVLPEVLILGPSNLNLPLAARIRRDFRVLDPTDSPEPTSSFLSLRCRSLRALVCTGLEPLDSQTLDLLPSLELIAASSAGIEHIDLPHCRRRGIAVTNARSAFSEDAADCAVALLIDVMRRISAGNRFVRAGQWKAESEYYNYPLGFKLGGKRVGIVGLGSIGSEVAKRLIPFCCSIAYNSRNRKSSVPYTYYANVLDLASNSDVLIVCCALTEETHHMINEDVMAALGKEGIIINVGRGALVDEKELVRRLVEGEIGGAGLDVFENEPEVPNELFVLNNVVLSPHRAFLTPEAIAAVQDLIFANLKAFFSNKPLMSLAQNE